MSGERVSKESLFDKLKDFIRGQKEEELLTTISSQEELVEFAHEVAKRVDRHLTLGEDTSPFLQELLTGLYENPGPKGVVFVDRRESPVRPILDVYVLWSHLLDMTFESEEEGVQLDAVDQICDAFHEKLDSKFGSTIDSLLRVINPVDHQSIESLADAMPQMLSEAQSVRILGGAEFKRE